MQPAGCTLDARCEVRFFFPVLGTRPGGAPCARRPFWMSSTQWGVVETVWAEGSVAGSMGAALATLLLCLWACLYGNRGLTFCKQADAQVHIDLHSRACSEVNFVIVLPSTAPYVRVFLVCPPTHLGMRFSRTGGLWSAGAGSGGRIQAGGCLCLSAPARALIGL